MVLNYELGKYVCTRYKISQIELLNHEVDFNVDSHYMPPMLSVFEFIKDFNMNIT